MKRLSILCRPDRRNSHRSRRRHRIETLESRRLLATVNQPPSFTASDPPTVLEDSGAQMISGFATFDPGDPSESGQSVVGYDVNNISDPALFDVLPAIDNAGNLTYTLAADAFGTSTFVVTVQDDGGTLDGGNDTSAAQTFLISVTGVNDAPSMMLGDEVMVGEDAGPQTIFGFAADFDPGPNEKGASTASQILHDEGTDGLTNTLSADNLNPTDVGKLAHGSNIVRGYIEAAQSVGNVDVFTFTIDPGFQLDSLLVLEYAYVTPPSNPNERNAFLGIDDTNSFPYDAFELDININPFLDETQFIGGTVFGLDDLPGAGGGDILPRAGVVTGSRFKPPLPAGTYTVYIQQTGPANTYTLDFRVTTTSKQSVAAYIISNISDPSLFSSPPQIDNNGNLTYTPAKNAHGSGTFEVMVQDDGGTDNDGIDQSAPMSATITIASINDAPTFTATDPPVVLENSGAQIVTGFATGFDPGPMNEDDQTIVAYNVTNISNPALFSVPPAIDTDGNLTYTLATDAFAPSTFDVAVRDSGGSDNGGVDTSANQTFTVTVIRQDLGDAPSQYPVSRADDGARHATGPLFLGAAVDVESDGQPTDAADGDGDDDDGVTVLADIVAASGSENIASFIVTASGAGMLDAWIDFNGDGDWDDSGEQIAASLAVSMGSNTLSYQIPADAVPGKFAARFRLSGSGGLMPIGAATDGEVEDYIANILDGSTSPDVNVGLADSEGILVVSGGQLIVRGSQVDLFAAPIDRVGAVHVLASSSDDTFSLDLSGGSVVPPGGLSLNGGDGTNGLRIVHADSNLDFSSGGTIIAQNFSTIDLADTHVNRITIDAAAVGALAPATGIVMVVGGQDDAIAFLDAADWRMGETAINQGSFVRLAINIAGGNETLMTQLPHAWQNLIRASDVNNSGDVTAGDALRIINELGRREFSDGDTQDLDDPLTIAEWPGAYFDQNGDDRVTSLDALRVINELARIALAGGESEARAVDQAIGELFNGVGVTAVEQERIASMIHDASPAHRSKLKSARSFHWQPANRPHEPTGAIKENREEQQAELDQGSGAGLEDWVTHQLDTSP